jgi:hypothetical protein
MLEWKCDFADGRVRRSGLSREWVVDFEVKRVIGDGECCGFHISDHRMIT